LPPTLLGWAALFLGVKQSAYTSSSPSMKKKTKELSPRDIDRIVGMAWEDRTPFDAIERQFGVPEKEVIKIMRREMHPKSFKHWRKHVGGRKTKHQALRGKR